LINARINEQVNNLGYGDDHGQKIIYQPIARGSWFLADSAFGFAGIRCGAHRKNGQNQCGMEETAYG
jgi:hypothetical protein